MDQKWIAISGDFESNVNEIIFKGKSITPIQKNEPQETDSKDLSSIGILVFDQLAGDGSISADIEFDEFDNDTVCEFILSYNVESKGFLSAGLGGGYNMFNIREWIPVSSNLEQSRWFTFDSSGDKSNRKSKIKYHLEAELIGSRINLAVDGVSVAFARIAGPIPNKAQIGLFCLGKNTIRISNIHISTKKAQAFIVMQFSSPFNEIYSDVIKKACDDFKIDPLRADEMYGPGLIIKDISEQILSSQVVIADVTPPNQNVYFEVGFAYGIEKPIILLAEKGTKLPFDLSAFRTLFYENSIAGKSLFDEGLRRHLKALLGRIENKNT
jgi:hypothetical protein